MSYYCPPCKAEHSRFELCPRVRRRQFLLGMFTGIGIAGLFTGTVLLYAVVRYYALAP